METKNKLAEYFLSDARDYLLRYLVLEESASHIGLRAKLVVDLMFSLECALKALYVVETDLSAKCAYKKIKNKLRHNISKLVSNLSADSRTVFTNTVTIDFRNYDVFHRYIFESEMAFREEIGVLGLTYYETINNPTWRKSFYTQIKNFIEYVESKNLPYFKTVSFSEINIDEQIRNFKDLRDIHSK